MSIAFFEVAPYEDDAIEHASFPGQECRRHREALSATSADQAHEAEVVSIFIYSKISDDVLQKLPNLKLIVTRSTGYDHIDLAACRKRGIAVSFVPSYGENTVAEHAFALLLALARKLQAASERTRRLDFSTGGLEGFDLKGKTLGVIGAGRIGRCAIRIGHGFGMEAVAFDPQQRPDIAQREGFSYAALDELLRRADVVSIHAALIAETYHLLDRDRLSLMKPSAILLNTARGPIVDSQALYTALAEGRLAGAGLDVLEGEEFLKDGAALVREGLTRDQLQAVSACLALLRLENVIVTPHVAYFTREGVGRLVATSLENIRAFLRGEPQNLVPGSP